MNTPCPCGLTKAQLLAAPTLSLRAGMVCISVRADGSGIECGKPLSAHPEQPAGGPAVGTASGAVEQEADPIIQGIYERLTENESEPVVDSFITFGPLTLLVRQEWINLKNTLLTESPDKRHKTIFLRGTSGRGKSSFVYYLMYCILIAAKGSRKRKAEQENEPVVGFVRNEGSVEVKFLLSLSGAKRVASIPFSVYYYIADIKGDVHMTNLAHCFTMAVASDDAGKSEFRKRVKETSGKTFAMLSPTREQMHSIFKGALPANEIDFRLDVVGCNPRVLGGTVIDETCELKPDFKMLVEETCAEILGCAETDILIGL